MSVEDVPTVAADGQAKHRLDQRAPDVETNGEAALFVIDEPGISGVIQLERGVDAGVLHETLASQFHASVDVPGLFDGGEADGK